MDMLRSEVRKLAAEDYTTPAHLAHASEQARKRKYQDFLIYSLLVLNISGAKRQRFVRVMAVMELDLVGPLMIL